MNRSRAAAALLPLALFAATACGSGSAKDAVDAAGKSGGASASASATPPSTAPTGGSTVQSPQGGQFAYLSDKQLKAALVPDHALPAGWTIDRSDNEPSGDKSTSEKPECDPLWQLLSPGAAKTVTARGQATVIAMDEAGGGKAYAMVGVNLASFSTGDAEKLIGAAEAALPRCATENATEDGMSFTVTTKKEKAPALGDQALAYSMTTRTDKGQSWVHAIVVVRLGTTIIESTYVNLTGATVKMPDEALVSAQVDRVRTVMAGGTPRD